MRQLDTFTTRIAIYQEIVPPDKQVEINISLTAKRRYCLLKKHQIYLDYLGINLNMRGKNNYSKLKNLVLRSNSILEQK